MYLNHGQFSISSSHLGTPGQLIQTVFQIFVHLNTMTGKTEEKSNLLNETKKSLVMRDTWR